MAGYVLGRECKFYYDAAGAGVGTYTELAITRTPSLDLAADEAVIEDRSVQWKRYKRGMLDAPLELEMSRKVGDTGYEVFRDAFLSGDYIGIAMASGVMTTVGEEVFEGDFIVTGFPLEEPLSEVGSVTVTMKLAADSSFTPTFSTVEAP
jgi:hypothetical protein